jgi:hypothetical protein
MPLEVRGTAIVDPAGRSVRFASYPVGKLAEAIVICEITSETLRHFGNDPNADKDELLGVFEIHKDTILMAASKLFDEGHQRPQVTMADFHNEAVGL